MKQMDHFGTGCFPLLLLGREYILDGLSGSSLGFVDVFDQTYPHEAGLLTASVSPKLPLVYTFPAVTTIFPVASLTFSAAFSRRWDIPRCRHDSLGERIWVIGWGGADAL